VLDASHDARARVLPACNCITDIVAGQRAWSRVVPPWLPGSMCIKVFASSSFFFSHLFESCFFLLRCLSDFHNDATEETNGFCKPVRVIHMFASRVPSHSDAHANHAPFESFMNDRNSGPVGPSRVGMACRNHQKIGQNARTPTHEKTKGLARAHRKAKKTPWWQTVSETQSEF
jgi:hypothetical protein